MLSTESGIVISVRFAQPANASAPIHSRPSGRVIASKAQFQKAPSSIRLTLLPRLMVTRLEQPRKALNPMYSTVSGRVMELRFSLAWNALSSISVRGDLKRTFPTPPLSSGLMLLSISLSLPEAIVYSTASPSVEVYQISFMP